MTQNQGTATVPRSNIELKARLADLEPPRCVAQSLATARLDDQHQVDTYFRSNSGRLKLREIDGQRAELIWYQRPDQSAAKQSRYTLVAVQAPVELKQALTGALGVIAVVDKHREIYLYHNVRIHLDRVQGLGTFLEFEAVLGDGIDQEQGQSQVAMLKERMQITDESLIEGSYADLLMEQTHATIS